MPWLQLVMDLDDFDNQRLERALMRHGASSISLQDAGDDPVLEPAPGCTPLWPQTRLSALFPPDVDGADLLRAIREELQVGELPRHHFEWVEDRPWAQEWLRETAPMRFGKRLWVCPKAQAPCASRAITVYLDPGLAFGTGSHQTTAMCLEWLDQAVLEQRRVMDYGCGSGILAIAAAKLGASKVVAVDNDPQALRAARENARFNGVDNLVEVVGAGDESGGEYDALVANILAEPLYELAPRFAECVSDGGHICLSGILTRQSDRLIRQYGEWFDIQLSLVREGWARLCGTRKRRS